jgi:hypothetical protein
MVAFDIGCCGNGKEPNGQIRIAGFGAFDNDRR